MVDFCEIEGWTEVRNARSKRTGHHVTFELALNDGRILRTRVSRPPDRTPVGKSVFAHILRDQLDVSPEEFWLCLRERKTPRRGVPELPPSESVPLWVVRELTSSHGVSQADVAQLDVAAAQGLLERKRSEET